VQSLKLRRHTFILLLKDNTRQEAIGKEARGNTNTRIHYFECWILNVECLIVFTIAYCLFKMLTISFLIVSISSGLLDATNSVRAASASLLIIGGLLMVNNKPFLSKK